jgi:hypothetical protein
MAYLSLYTWQSDKVRVGASSLEGMRIRTDDYVLTGNSLAVVPQCKVNKSCDT